MGKQNPFTVQKFLFSETCMAKNYLYDCRQTDEYKRAKVPYLLRVGITKNVKNLTGNIDNLCCSRRKSRRK